MGTYMALVKVVTVILTIVFFLTVNLPKFYLVTVIFNKTVY